ncbi:MAG: hypothetical protein K8U57_21550 [Planctomycetes bacterium]|nr:hypothetical protein [Planctomycetota bacterium]
MNEIPVNVFAPVAILLAFLSTIALILGFVAINSLSTAIKSLKYDVIAVPTQHAQQFRQMFPLHVAFADFVKAVEANADFKWEHSRIQSDLLKHQALHAGRDVELFVYMKAMP